MKTIAAALLSVQCELADAELAERIELRGRLFDPELLALHAATESIRRETVLDQYRLCRLEARAAARRDEIEEEVLTRHELTAEQYVDWLNEKLWRIVGMPIVNDPNLLKRLRGDPDKA